MTTEQHLLQALVQLAFMARTSGRPTPELLRACEGAEAAVAEVGLARALPAADTIALGSIETEEAAVTLSFRELEGLA